VQCPRSNLINHLFADWLKIVLTLYPVSVSFTSTTFLVPLEYSLNLLGYHPWFTHWIALSPALSKEDHYRQLFRISTKDESEAFEKLLPTFPDPITLDDVLSELRHNLQSFPLAMLGEVGLDSSFRIPVDFFASPREKTPLRIPLEHQLAILEAQLSVAVDLRRNVSFHSVKSQLVTMQLFERMSRTYGDRWMDINVDIHSCGLSPQMWRDMEVSFIISVSVSFTFTYLLTDKKSKCISIPLHYYQQPIQQLQGFGSSLLSFSYPCRVRYRQH
jgi:Tat protein secretion system quality control protein TatD with DNase activity